MEFHLATTTCVGGLSTVVNGLFVALIIVLPPANLGIFRSQYYVGAVSSFFAAATQAWAVNSWIPNGTLFVVFSARSSHPVPFLSCLAAMILQFTMLSSNFAVRYAAVRGGWIRYYLTNQLLFYSVQTSCVLVAYIPPIYLMFPTPELRAEANTTYSETFTYDFMKEFYFVCSYDYLVMGSVLVHHLIFLMAGGFQAVNLLLMLSKKKCGDPECKTSPGNDVALTSIGLVVKTKEESVEIFGVITYIHISKNTQSAKLRDVNNRLLRARIFQACFAFIFLFLPGLIINTSMLLRADVSSIAPVLSSLSSFATLFNPFIEIQLTPGYRKSVFRAVFSGHFMQSTGEITTSARKLSLPRQTVIQVK